MAYYGDGINDKLRELAEQAEQYALDRANEGSDEDYDYAFDDDFRQKFAELIVGECIFAVEDAGGIDKYHYTKAISKHFGVEE